LSLAPSSWTGNISTSVSKPCFFLSRVFPEIHDGQRHCLLAGLKDAAQLLDIVYVCREFLELLVRDKQLGSENIGFFFLGRF